MKSLKLVLKLTHPKTKETDVVEILIPEVLLVTGFKIGFLVPNAVEDKLRQLLKPKYERAAFPFKTDCIEEWLMGFFGESFSVLGANSALQVSWI